MMELILFFATLCHPHFCLPVLTGKNQWLKPLFATTCQPWFKDSTAKLAFLPVFSRTRLCVFICYSGSTRLITCSSFNEVNQLIKKLAEENVIRQIQKWVSLSEVGSKAGMPQACHVTRVVLDSWVVSQIWLDSDSNESESDGYVTYITMTHCDVIRPEYVFAHNYW